MLTCIGYRMMFAFKFQTCVILTEMFEIFVLKKVNLNIWGKCRLLIFAPF